MTPSLLTLLALSAAPPAPVLTFEDHVRPVLKAYCFECHGEDRKVRGGLDLRLRRLAVAGGDKGPALVPGRPEESAVLDRIRTGQMPPGKVKVPERERELIARWIRHGAPTRSPEPTALAAGLHITEGERGFWSFQPVRRPAVPSVRSADRLRSPVDSFLLQRLEAAGLGFAPEADPLAQLRRVTFDLTGLPPAPEEVEAFQADASGDAYQRAVDRLLSSPAYGERWGRHWLDVAGYADSDGGTADPVRRFAWKYRDYVIGALNANRPFDRFVTEQLAGDELANPNPKLRTQFDLELLTATGFLRTAPDLTATGEVERKLGANQVVADTVQVVATSLLGLTVQCAQCHNHRYDPIPQADYYRLRAALEPALNPAAWLTPAQRQLSLETDADRRKSAAIEAEAARIDAERKQKLYGYIEATLKLQLAQLPRELRLQAEKAYRTSPAKRDERQQKLLRDHPSVNVSAGSLYLYSPKAAADLKRYDDRAASLRATKPVPDYLAVLAEPAQGTPPTTRVFHRGDPDQPREEVGPGGLTVLAGLGLPPIPPRDPARPTTGRRLALARHLTSGRHPLTARVLVNRVWMHHFGRGIVGTPADFGSLGEHPTHPELLDWLADEFVASGWDLKHLHRLIVTSGAYRQGNDDGAEKRQRDPDNRLLGRRVPRRLEAEAVRDAMLAASGRLTTRLGGQPVPVMPDEVGQVVLGVDIRDAAAYPRGKPIALGDEEFRRGVYVQARRSLPLGMLEAFDAAVPAPNCECRTPSTVAPQSLALMNGTFISQQAAHLAERVVREAGPEPGAQVARAWKLAFGREPSSRDLDAGTGFLTRQAAGYSAEKKPAPDRLALAALCQAVLASNRFLYVE